MRRAAPFGSAFERCGGGGPGAGCGACRGQGGGRGGGEIGAGQIVTAGVEVARCSPAGCPRGRLLAAGEADLTTLIAISRGSDRVPVEPEEKAAAVPVAPTERSIPVTPVSSSATTSEVLTAEYLTVMCAPTGRLLPTAADRSSWLLPEASILVVKVL